MTDQEERPPFALAIEWVSKITTVTLEMLLPGLAGHWLDRRWGTGFMALAGLALGLTVGIWHLLYMTGAIEGSADSGRQGTEQDQE